jgi:exo-beta-1,3-glucanase (GH17 family)
MSIKKPKLGCIPGYEYGNAICYSGYRDGQSPVSGEFPSKQEIADDLNLLNEHWDYLRLYDCSKHADRVLSVILSQDLDFKVMLGSDMKAEVSNPECPWGADYEETPLSDNRGLNDEEIDRMIQLALRYPDVVCSLSIGNEATVDWSDHLVPVDRLISFVRRIKHGILQPVTFCENYVPWIGKLKPLVDELDFLSVHTYPVWEYKTMDEALEYSRQNYHSVADFYPDKHVVITEAGWTTRSNGQGIEVNKASDNLQLEYLEQLQDWSKREKVLTFIFEAFDKSWKGSEDPDEPEKHWVLYRVDRSPKKCLRKILDN